MIDNYKLKKHKILDEVFIKKEDTLKKLEEITKKCRQDFLINSESLEVIFKDHINKIPQLISRFLIALFLMKERGLINSDSINLNEMSGKLKVKTTSLSKPLGKLIKKGLIKKDNEGHYSIMYHKILEVLGGDKNAQDK